MLRTLAVATLIALSPVMASAQILWDAPPLVSHVAPSGLSLFLVSPQGGDLGGLVTFRHEAGPVGLGYRFAISDENGSSDVAFAGGVDISGFLARAVEGSEVDVMWWSGAGIGVGQESVVSIPVGALIGWSGQGGDVILSPYGGGHITLDVSTVDQDNVRLGGSFDLGLDVVLSSGWLVRFGGSIGDRDALALGVKIGS
ncbi:MAG: hypothetical protein O2958_12485 [Gemmatimonadetes bacterium]|nr:hypothetical protein [Gemmatimonadota bacterium]MDA1103609.1 hypothetical protein [Gemmatimonadota bacterium]